MSVFWKRKIVVNVAGLVISAPKINLDVKLDVEDTPNNGTVAIYNLSENHERQIIEKGVAITIDAGYGDVAGRLFTGSVQRVERERERLQRITKIAISSSDIENSKLGGYTERTYLGAYSVRGIVNDIVTQDLQLPLGRLDPIPEHLTVENWVWAESSHEALKNLLKTHKITAYQDGDGIIQFNVASKKSVIAANITLNKENGLLESPTVTDEGIRAKSLLNPSMRIGDIVAIESNVVSGAYKIVAMTHTGSNWDGNFNTEIEAHDVDQS